MTRNDEEMHACYRERAPRYERVYEYPERAADLATLGKFVGSRFAGRDVIEVAAGTGYWTALLAAQARSVLATDASPEPLAQLASRSLPATVEARVHDAYTVNELGRHWNGGFAGLWFSHVPIERRREWLHCLHRCLLPGVVVLLIDNTEAQCVRIPITRTDTSGNTYQQRSDDVSGAYEVLKNFPSDDELLTVTADLGRDHEVLRLDHYWALAFTT